MLLQMTASSCPSIKSMYLKEKVPQKRTYTLNGIRTLIFPCFLNDFFCWQKKSEKDLRQKSTDHCQVLPLRRKICTTWQVWKRDALFTLIYESISCKFRAFHSFKTATKTAQIRPLIRAGMQFWNGRSTLQVSSLILVAFYHTRHSFCPLFFYEHAAGARVAGGHFAKKKN